jgi:RND superfamily putative drug exporter
MFSFLGRVIVTHPWKICAGWLALAMGLYAVAPAWHTKAQDDDIHFLPERCSSVRGYHLLEKAFPQDVFASKAVFVIERNGRCLTRADFTLVDHLTADLERLRREEPDLRIGSIASYRDLAIGKRLISADKQCTLIQMSLGSPFLAEQTRRTMDRAEYRLRQRLKGAVADLPHFYATGAAGVGRDMNKACADSLDGTTWATVILVVVILLVVYRAPLLALVPLLTIAVSVVVSLKVLALATLLPGIHLVNVSKVFAIVILYGAGTDYCLFLISRYREELEADYSLGLALRRSICAVGGALTASAATVMCGLGLMIVAEFAKVRYAGPAIAVSLGVALLASLTLAPALLQLLGNVVFWPRGTPRGRRDRAVDELDRKNLLPLERAAILAHYRPGFWHWISRKVVARPVLVWSTAVLLLLPLAALGLHVEANYQPTGELPPASRSILGLKAIQRHFTAGETGPITVLLSSPTDWDTPEGHDTLEHLCASFASLDNVAEVRSLTQPLGQPLAEAAGPVEENGLLGKLFQVVKPGVNLAMEAAHQASLKHYVATLPKEDGGLSVTRLDLVLRSDPFASASLTTLGVVQAFLEHELPRCPLPSGGAKAEIYGLMVNSHDLAEVTEADRFRVNCFTLLGIFLILLGLVRRPWLAAYLLVTVLFSYFATMGATLLAGSYWSGRPLDQVDWRVPFFLFTILVAVGEDYNILLVTRILQERAKHGSSEGIRRALAHTGGTITSCGLIMAGTFATLMLAGLGTLKQVGFALAFGVLIDTFVVRTFLVPAFILMVWGKEKPVLTLHGRRQTARSPFGMRRAA